MLAKQSCVEPLDKFSAPLVPERIETSAKSVDLRLVHELLSCHVMP
jgi:hypothetical protein